MKRTHGQFTGHIAARLIDWTLSRWFKLSVLLCILCVTYSIFRAVYIFEVDSARFIDFTGWFFQWAEHRGTLS